MYSFHSSRTPQSSMFHGLGLRQPSQPTKSSEMLQFREETSGCAKEKYATGDHTGKPLQHRLTPPASQGSRCSVKRFSETPTPKCTEQPSPQDHACSLWWEVFSW